MFVGFGGDYWFVRCVGWDVCEEWSFVIFVGFDLRYCCSEEDICVEVFGLDEFVIVVKYVIEIMIVLIRWGICVIVIVCLFDIFCVVD